MPQLRLALAQVNPTVGDLDGNAALVLAWAKQAREAGAHVAAFPELVLNGYPVEDLALRSSFVDASRAALDTLADDLVDGGMAELVCVVGYIDRCPETSDASTSSGQHRLGVPKGAPQNCAAVIHHGKVVARYAKHHLPNYGVFDEARYFVPGDTTQIIQVHSVDVAICICEDLWQDGPSANAKAANAGLLLVLNGSPFEADKDDVRLELVARRAAEAECTLAYVNMVGGQDELVYDGDSIVVDAKGTTLARATPFAEELLVVDLDLPAATPEMPDESQMHDGLKVARAIISSEPVPEYDPLPSPITERVPDQAEVYQAIVLGLRDYVRKNGFESVLLGMSGGIDSTLVAALACDAIGAQNVYGLSNPSDFSSDASKTDAAEQARRTGLNLDTVAIAPMVEAFQGSLHLEGLALENLQARIRAVIWMGLSNQHGHLVLACGNKSELAVGYSTIYGDAVGGFAPLKDVFKTQVWQLARWRNAAAERRDERPPIPEDVITKEPSAELSPGQKDSDSLPPYSLLDEILDDYIEKDHGSARLVADGFDRELVEKVLRLVDRAEYKRRQYPPGPKVSARNFGRDRRLPITSQWREVAPPD
ncbi:MAG TPA: NAD+ synthase [Nocardioidaceae bacterium]|nr:NAD+ synthase [Nocardioidaceae bacterium]